MARYRYRQRICTTGLRHGTNRLRQTDTVRDCLIVCRRSQRNLKQCLPHSLLKLRPLQVECKIDTQRRFLDIPHNLGEHAFKITVCTNQSSIWKPLLEIVRQHLMVITEKNRADTTSALRNKYGSK